MSELKTYPTTPDFVKKRNHRLLNFFNCNGFSDEIRIIGDENTPAVLYLDEFILNCYVKNFDLIFMSAIKDGHEIKRYKLKEAVPDVREELLKLIQTLPSKKTFKICLENQNNLFLVGWNGKTPVFGENKPKVFFDKAKANQIADSFTYKCKVI